MSTGAANLRRDLNPVLSRWPCYQHERQYHVGGFVLHLITQPTQLPPSINNPNYFTVDFAKIKAEVGAARPHCLLRSPSRAAVTDLACAGLLSTK